MTIKALVDDQGRISLPEEVLQATGIKPMQEVLLKVIGGKLVIETEPNDSLGEITIRIATIDLPVADWPAMEQESEKGKIEL
jgi:bifunctional DNA-binding transcriptional regulator/antitoxin component of YhaV-PrlF toxin-antitoxin module